MINDKQFNVTIKNIKKNSEDLAQAIHEAGLFAIEQVNQHGNAGFGVRLVEAMGKKHDAQRVVSWLIYFGKFGVKKGELVYRNRKDITAETIDAMQAKATDTPYWELNKQKPLVESVDYLSMLMAIVRKHEGVEAKVKEGKEVNEKNAGVLAEVQAIIAKHTAKAATPADKAIVTL